MVVIKRDGREVPFDKKKIFNAITRAFEETERVTPEAVKKGAAEDVSSTITSRLYNRYQKRNRAISVEEIQDDVETELMREDAYAVAKAYIKYRYEHELMRSESTLDSRILSLVDGVNETIIQENSNKNPMVLSTQRDYIAGEVSRSITERLLLPDDIVQAHEEGIIHFHDSDYFIGHMFNCFGSKTRFVTDEGVVEFRQCKNGEEVRVLDRYGVWRTATVRKYGRQKLYDITFKSCRTEKTVTCTKDHRWVLKDGTVTTNLSVGDTLLPFVGNYQDAKPKTKRECEMFALGMVIGDGSDRGNCGVYIRLCGTKSDYAKYFERAGYCVSKTGWSDDYMASSTRWRKQQFLDSCGWRYLSSDDKKMLFLGYYAADGCTDRNMCHTADRRVSKMIEEISAIAGYHIVSKKEMIRDTQYKKGALLIQYSFSLHTLTNRAWKVTCIKEHCKGNDLQDAWCVEEPVTHTFTLDGGMVTGNCCLLNLEDMLQNGTVISGTLIEKPHSFSTACNVATQIIAQAASNQYGGQSISLAHLAPFVDVSRKKIRAQVEKEFLKISSPDNFKDPEAVISEIVEDRVREEVKRGVQTIQYQVITLMTTNG